MCTNPTKTTTKVYNRNYVARAIFKVTLFVEHILYIKTHHMLIFAVSQLRIFCGMQEAELQVSHERSIISYVEKLSLSMK